MHRTIGELDACLGRIRSSPRDRGRLEAIVIRPKHGDRVEPVACRLEEIDGAEGDVWISGFSPRPAPGAPELDAQLTLMNAHAAEAVAESRHRWAMAGDQLYVDLDLSEEHLRAGDRLRIGGAVIQITSKPHNGCRKFAARFGEDALVWVNSPEGKRLHLRGIYARVIEPGEIRVGDAIEKLPD